MSRPPLFIKYIRTHNMSATAKWHFTKYKINLINLILALLMLRPEPFRMTKSITWLQTPSLLVSTGLGVGGWGWLFKNIYELLNLRALKSPPANKIHIFQCMDKIFCVEFQRYPLKFHTKYLTHTLKDMILIKHWSFKSSYIEELIGH